LLHATNVFETAYTKEEKEHFLAYIHSHIVKMNGEPEMLKQLFFKLYANPVINKLG